MKSDRTDHSALPELADAFPESVLRRVRRRLRNWFRSNGRVLPWRATRDPYAIWLSEIMLQQTTVAAVIPYFDRFVRKFPDVHALANATEDEVLQVWEGLGYYSRARNIHRTARIVSEQLDGCFPRKVHELQELPGIGRYTAGAIRSFAFDQPAPILEANTVRLHARLLAFDGDCRKAAGQRLLWGLAELLVPERQPGEINQSLMELGATVCVPTTPDCERCPVSFACGALARGEVDRIPRPATRPAVTPREEVAVVFVRDGRVLMRRCQTGERWSGLWDFPRVLLREHEPVRGQIQWSSQGLSCSDHGLIERQLLAEFGIEGRIDGTLQQMRHSVTRYRIRLWCVAASSNLDRETLQGDWEWCNREELSGLALSVTGRKLVQSLADSILD